MTAPAGNTHALICRRERFFPSFNVLSFRTDCVDRAEGKEKGKEIKEPPSRSVSLTSESQLSSSSPLPPLHSNIIRCFVSHYSTPPLFEGNVSTPDPPSKQKILVPPLLPRRTDRHRCRLRTPPCYISLPLPLRMPRIKDLNPVP